ncbi:NERD domain-containing protein/DEAD/DEAH box helicase [Cobetia amphilecti]|uniref:NERD domain-containing protein/DEAD/DEAH box helicase n=1 Tax=Cobetia amphilecti TaxID=1055104 RepID=A0AAP4TXK3_9GAMM|nr:NERD domain-containing protein/DEAD/DEAH box helicase [Cobetia amphilecti]MDO6671337.1 NERD domain-containing protein/DEAD/DEAH box helicase [Cobetia amphilecti]
MRRFVSPPVEHFDRLRQPLTKGERIVFDLFNETLAPEWEIYIQPHLNGLRPDFVLMNPAVGIAVFEVKDWNLDAMRYWVEDRPGRAPQLWASDGRKEFSIHSQNPVEKIFKYKNEIHELYCPRLNAKAGFATITAGIIFPFANTEDVQKLLRPCLDYRGMLGWPQYNPVSGAEAITESRVHLVFPESRRLTSRFMSGEQADDMRNWLIEPDFSATQRKIIELDSNQRSYVTSRTQSGYRRIKGPAGSGKSLILGARAAQLLGEGKEVLVVTFNITLLHYLMDVAVRWPNSKGRTRQDITWLNFHAWCKRVCLDSDHEKEYLDLWRGAEEVLRDEDSVLRFRLPALVGSCIDSDTDELVQRYDAVLVDEGQDFLPSWWNVLRKVCRDGGEMLLVADATQDVYGTAHSWTDEAMTGAGFLGGRWAELQTCYRLPPSALQVARNFASKYLPPDTVDLPNGPQGELDLYPCALRWVQTSPLRSVEICLEEILQMAPRATNAILAIPDITFLTGSQKMGASVVNALEAKGIHAVHTYSTDKKESRRRKMGFYMGDARVKATTLHSFKGWEARAIVIFVGEKTSGQTLALIYAGLTRLKRHEEGSFLTVVSCAGELIEFGKSWDVYEER